MYETELAEDAEILLVAYGTTARIVRSAIKLAREQGVKAGMFRPITVWPYPKKELAETAKNVKEVIVVEMSAGQMLEDVELSLLGSKPISFLGTQGGVIPTIQQVLDKIIEVSEER